MDLDAARETALLATRTIEDGAAGYVLLAARKRGGAPTLRTGDGRRP
jgi:hypothetical protein